MPLCSFSSACLYTSEISSSQCLPPLPAPPAHPESPLSVSVFPSGCHKSTLSDKMESIQLPSVVLESLGYGWCVGRGYQSTDQVWVEIVAVWARKASNLAALLFICKTETVISPAISGVPLWERRTAMEIKRPDVSAKGNWPWVRAGAHWVTSLSGPREKGGWGAMAQNNARKRETPKRGPSFIYPGHIPCLYALF